MASKRGKTWAARFSYRDSKGDRKQWFEGGFATEEEADRKEAKVRREYEEARKQAARQEHVGYTTLGDWAGKWAQSTLKMNTRPSGYQTAEGRVRNHIIPLLGHLIIEDVRKSHSEDFKFQLKEKGLSPKTRNHCVGMVKQILDDAVDDELIPRNPWRRVKRESVEEEWNWYQPAEMVRLLRSVKKHRLKWLLEISLGCRAGLRCSEVAGLFVEDCNLRTGDIRIQRDVVRGLMQPPKSLAGRRTIRVPSDLLEELKQRVRYAKLHPVRTFVDSQGKTHKGRLLCLNADGDLHKSLPKTLEKPIRFSIKKAISETITEEKPDGDPLRILTHRDLRHTYASHLRLKGVPLEDIKELLGHSSIQMTLRYAHISEDKFAAAAAALETIKI